MGYRIFSYLEYYDSHDVRGLILDTPDLDVNWQNSYPIQYTALHQACELDSPEVTTLLLLHPAINVNIVSGFHSTACCCACLAGATEAAKVILQDPRVDLSLGRSPVFAAAKEGHLEVVKWLIALQPDQVLKVLEKREAEYDSRLFTPIEVARKNRHSEVVWLLSKFKEDQVTTCHEVQLELGVSKGCTADLFALVVFLCDGLLKITSKPPPRAPPLTANQLPRWTSQQDTAATTNETEVGVAKYQAAIRFFRIVKALPMELQMILCHQAQGSRRRYIRNQDSEAAFRFLAQSLVRESSWLTTVVSRMKRSRETVMTLWAGWRD